MSRCRYIKYENTGDQFVGRALSELPILLKKFAVCFPYFDFSTRENKSEKEKHKFTIDVWIYKRPPSGAQENETVFIL